jgi:hypothetical protein
MPVTRRRFSVLALILVVTLASAAGLGVHAQGRITPPVQHLGASPGDDYFLATYTQFQSYLETLAKQSDRLKVVEIGKTAEGRPMLMSIITSPENHKKLDRYKEISQRLARADGLTDEQARALASEGKAVVWIDGGLHGSEVSGAQQLIELVYQMTSRSDPETLRILNEVILLAVPANPDGMELVSSWYMREADPLKRSMDNLPRLYQKYVGHDNNRDSYIANQPETAAMNRALFIEWIPQIMYNHHQTGPQGVMLFAPPFRDPFNYNFDPLVVTGIDQVGAAMHSRLIAEGKPGSTMRGGSNYSTWFNGGLRTTVYFHNQIGLLTEMKGTPTPMDIVFVPERQLPSTETPMPIPPQKWHFRQSIDYSISLDRAVLDFACRYRETLLFNIYRMGHNSIERGSRDNWTIHPQRIRAIVDQYAKDNPKAAPRVAGPRGYDPIPAKYFDILKDPAYRDARAYVIPSDQADFLTATKFVNALLKAGIVVHRASAPFQAAGRAYPAGSYVVRAAQAFRPHVRDMFEPQDHPDDIPYPGGPPKPPYDATGWTLAYQMGVAFDRVVDAVDGPFETVPGLITPRAGSVAKGKAAGFLLRHELNDAFVATNRLLAAKEDVYWLTTPLSAGGQTYPAGTIYIAARPTTRPFVEKLAAELGVSFDAAVVTPAVQALKLRPVRIGLWDQYGGSMPSGWIRWMLEQAFPVSFEVVYPPALDAGSLSSRFDVLIFPDEAIPEADAAERGSVPSANIPAEYRDRIGRVTVAKTVPQLRRFVEDGGTIIAIGSSSSIGYHLGLPISDALVERLPGGLERKLPADKYYIPGSLLQASVDNTNPLAYGMGEKVDMFFDNSPTFRLKPEASVKGVHPVAWFAGATPLRSGWAWGQQYLDGGVAVLEAPLGKGKVLLFGPEITFRAQPHGTFKLLFNGIYYGSAAPVNLGVARR